MFADLFDDFLLCLGGQASTLGLIRKVHYSNELQTQYEYAPLNRASCLYLSKTYDTDEGGSKEEINHQWDMTNKERSFIWRLMICMIATKTPP